MHLKLLQQEDINFKMLNIPRTIYLFIKGIPYRKKNFLPKNKTLILLNGPSLNEDIKEISRDEYEKIICVNHFADSSLYLEIKPNIYVFQDSYFWDSKVRNEYKLKRQKTFENILEKTNWPIQVWFPSYCKNLEIFSSLKENKFIHLKTFNAAYIDSTITGNIYRIFEPFIHFLWEKNLFAPPPSNVSNCALYISYLNGSKFIDVIGLNLSFFKCIEVDKKDNKLFSNNEHFYGKEKIYIYKDKVNLIHSKIHEEMYKYTSVFYVLNSMSKFFEKRNITVNNLTKESYVDCFNRKL